MRGGRRHRRRLDLDTVFSLDAYTQHVDTVFDRLRSSTNKEEPFMPEAVAHVGSGKVRELYALDDDRLLLVASDRHLDVRRRPADRDPRQGPACSPGCRRSGSRGREIVPNHLLALGDDARSTECRRLEMLPIECVVRGYLSGSGWKDYASTGATSGHVLPKPACRSRSSCRADLHALDEGARGHDENIDADRAAELVGRELFEQVERTALALYTFAAEYARERGIVIADTKFEFGLDADRRLVLGDEALTPDSSRFWPADEYRPGGSQPSFDKQFVRDYCESLGWDKTPPGPELPEEVVAGTRARYVEAFERLTEHPVRRLRRGPDRVTR